MFGAVTPRVVSYEKPSLADISQLIHGADSK
jgi:hypothetical protein